jgi:hypothetical protein
LKLTFTLGALDTSLGDRDLQFQATVPDIETLQVWFWFGMRMKSWTAWVAVSL